MPDGERAGLPEITPGPMYTRRRKRARIRFGSLRNFGWKRHAIRLVVIAFGGLAGYSFALVLIQQGPPAIIESLLPALFGSFMGVLVGWGVAGVVLLPWWITMPLEDCFPNSRTLERAFMLRERVFLGIIWAGPLVGCAMSVSRFEPGVGRPLEFWLALTGSATAAGAFAWLQRLAGRPKR